MRVNSEEAIRRGIAYRKAQGGKSWLELTRAPEMQQRSRDFFAGRNASAGEASLRRTSLANGVLVPSKKS